MFAVVLFSVGILLILSKSFLFSVADRQMGGAVFKLSHFCLWARSASMVSPGSRQGGAGSKCSVKQERCVQKTVGENGRS